ncbi:MAG TPA: GNAT family N-acetyltransferase [Acidimicrobiales bacterium]|nr:GNAT family N-acetyltransferase [Acidimicrobiales bacterium]
MRVVYIRSEATHDLRRRVLREDRPEAVVEFPGDHAEGAFHLGAVDEAGTVVGVVSLFPEPTPHRPGRRALRLRGMAVEPSLQGSGVGGALLAAAVTGARGSDYEVMWANARDTALEFYRRRGWEVVGDGFESVGLPHHVVVLDL